MLFLSSGLGRRAYAYNRKLLFFSAGGILLIGNPGIACSYLGPGNSFSLVLLSLFFLALGRLLIRMTFSSLPAFTCLAFPSAPFLFFLAIATSLESIRFTGAEP